MEPMTSSIMFTSRLTAMEHLSLALRHKRIPAPMPKPDHIQAIDDRRLTLYSDRRRPGGAIKVQYNFNSSVGGGTYPFPNAWMKLTRAGNTFTAYVSADGVTWTEVLSKTLAINTSATAGLLVNSHNATTLGTATFDNVSFTPGGPPSVTSVSPSSGSTAGGPA